MADVLISYSSKHRDLTRALAAAIEAQYGPGSVWWDTELENRAGYADQIKAAMEAARAIIVIWTAGAIVSDYVYAEATYANGAKKLINARPADTPFSAIPEPFNIHHIDDLDNTGRILATLAKVMRGIPIPTRVPLAEIYFRQHGKRVLEPKQFPLPTDRDAIRRLSPSDLLHAKYAVVEYDDATGMRARMLDWCCPPERTEGRLIHGPGGLGKTRLMIEVAARLRDEHGWQAGFLDRPPEDKAWRRLHRSRRPSPKRLVNWPALWD